MPRTFAPFLRRLQKRLYPSIRAMADAIDMDHSYLSRAMQTHGQPFNVKGCLVLARGTGVHPSEVLRAAGKGEIADLIEALYGPGHEGLSPDQQELLDAFAGITDHAVRRSLIDVAKAARTVVDPERGGAPLDDDPAAAFDDAPALRAEAR